MALVGALGEPLEERRGWRDRALHEGRLTARRDGGHQPVDRGLALVLEGGRRLYALDEPGGLLQAQHRRRHAPRLAGRAPAAVRIGRLQGGFDHSLEPARATDGEPCRALVMYLEGNRWLPREQASPPAPKKTLVQRLEQHDDRLRAGSIRPIGIDPQTHVAAAAPGLPA